LNYPKNDEILFNRNDILKVELLKDIGSTIDDKKIFSVNHSKMSGSKSILLGVIAALLGVLTAEVFGLFKLSL